MLPKHPSPSDPEIRPVRVLLVDDAAHVRSELRQLLELTGVVKIVGEAGDGLEALRLAAELAPDVVIMDLEMPGLDGCEATCRIKAMHASTRVIILSVHAGPVEQRHAREAGADSFVVKGALFETLMNAILGKVGKSNSFDPEKGDHI